MVADHEEPLRVLRLGAHEAGLEAQDLAIVLVELLEVLLGGLGYEVRHRAHGVVPGAVAGVGRRPRAGHGALGQLHGRLGVQLRAQLLPEVLPREVVGVINEEVVVAQQRDVHAHCKVVAMDVLRVLAWLGLWAIHLVLAHRQLRLPEEDGEVVAAAVQWVLLADLHHVVRQEEEDGEGPPLELRRGDVIVDSEEAQDLPVVLQELLHVRVDVAAPEHDLTVDLLVGPRLRGLGSPQRLPGLHPGICLQGHGESLSHASLLEVLAREVVAVREDDGLAVDVQARADDQVLGHDVAASRCWKSVPPDELALRNPAVVLPRLQDVASVVFEVIEDDHLPHAVVLEVRLHHRLLEVAVEPQHVPVVGVPGRQLHSLGLLACLEVRPLGAVGQGARAPVLGWPGGPHKLGLVVREALLGLHALVVQDVPRLGLVVVLLLVREGVARQVGQRLEVRHAHGRCGAPGARGREGGGMAIPSLFKEP
mmetsp:Transcript_22935/g.64984  ORF Transcript_22935/g.64984 Transcript_22935/m.64984 type:complete len:479 (+) Transcript_22935:1098-2534(+)